MLVHCLRTKNSRKGKLFYGGCQPPRRGGTVGRGYVILFFLPGHKRLGDKKNGALGYQQGVPLGPVAKQPMWSASARLIIARLSFSHVRQIVENNRLPIYYCLSTYASVLPTNVFLLTSPYSLHPPHSSISTVDCLFLLTSKRVTSGRA